MNEKLTPRERFGLLLIDEIPDRVVIYPLVTSHAAKISGCSVADYCSDGQIMGKSQVEAWRYYRHDAVSIFSDVGLIAEAMGSKYQIRENDVPILVEPVIKDESGYDSLRIPDPYSDGRLKVYIDAINYCYDTVGDIVPVIVYIPAPFTTAAQLCGISGFLKDTIRNSDRAHHLLNICAEAGEKLIDACMSIGGHPMLVDPLASCSVISPRIFSEYALPYIKRLLHFMHSYDLDTMLHICGETELVLKEIGETETDLLSFDCTDCFKAKTELGEAIRLIGNISPKEMLVSSGEKIHELVKNTVICLKDSPKGCIIATGCEIPVNTPVKNVKELIETAKVFGKY